MGRRRVGSYVEEFGEFSRACYPGHTLRGYQLEAAGPILEAVEGGRAGPREFVILFSRQAGKDELLAQLQAFLLLRRKRSGGGIVMAAPTFKPQCVMSKRRLLARMETAKHDGARSVDGYRVVCGRAATAFMSAGSEANVRGETADALLIANEAQDISCEVWDSRFAPMAASTNAPSVFSGTPWAAGSLLSRQTFLAEAGTIFRVDWQRVAEELPAYGDHVRARMAQLGESHPFIRSEYCLEELDSAGGMFPPGRVVQMRGYHERQYAPTPGRAYALLLDVAGADEDAPDDIAARVREKRRDSTALTVVEVDLSSVADDLLRKPTYRVVDRRHWLGEKHSSLMPTLLDLARNVWRARWFVIDATGIGAGLASFLSAALRGQAELLPFVFSQASKSDLGWAFLGAIESGRYKEHADDGRPETRAFWEQVGACTYNVQAGPGKLMRWSVPESRGHDDLLISAALVAALDDRDWRPRLAVGRTRAWA